MNRNLKRRALGIIALFACTHSAAAQGSESLFGISVQNLVVIDPGIPAVVSSTPMTGVPVTNFRTAAHDGTRIYGLNTETVSLYSIHPANGRAESVGQLMAPVSVNQFPALEWIRSRDELWWVRYDELYLVDRVTGEASHQGWLAGLDPYDGIMAMAESPAGVVIGIGGQFQQGLTVYDINLDSHLATRIGFLSLPALSYLCLGLAFRSNGELWASVGGSGGSSIDGLYRVDLSTLTAQFAMSTSGFPLIGLAFGPTSSTTTYCTAKPTSNGCVPAISATGIASPTASSGFTISCSGARNQTAGILTFGMSGAAVLPFGGGTVCVAQPRLRAGMWSSGGNASPAVDCSGAWSLDFNAWLSTHPPIPPGGTVWAQWIGRDNGFAPPNNYSLSNALEVTMIP